MLCFVPVELHSTASGISSKKLPCDLAVYGYTLGSTMMIYIHLTFYSGKATHLYTYLSLLLKLTWNTHKSVKYVLYLLYSVFCNSVSVWPLVMLARLEQYVSVNCEQPLALGTSQPASSLMGASSSLDLYQGLVQYTLLSHYGRSSLLI